MLKKIIVNYEISWYYETLKSSLSNNEVLGLIVETPFHVPIQFRFLLLYIIRQREYSALSGLLGNILVFYILQKILSYKHFIFKIIKALGIFKIYVVLLKTKQSLKDSNKYIKELIYRKFFLHTFSKQKTRNKTKKL